MKLRGCDPERVETMARAIHAAGHNFTGPWDDVPPRAQNDFRRAAAAAIAADPSPAEEAVKRVEALIEDGGHEGWVSTRAVRAALASPAPAPQGEEPTCYCGRLGHRLGGPILHKRTEECPR